MPALSVLDLVPVRAGQTTGQALQASLELARVADDLGYRRYWVAEHHNTESVAATNPPVLIAMIAGATDRIRVGSGGVMLPNHAPLVVAEQFALLEAAHPGRIDLGIGRAPGTDGLTQHLLRGATEESAQAAVARFPQYVDDIAMLMSPGGAEVSYAGRRHGIRATPQSVGAPMIWLLGSSDYSARLAAEKGLPYVFAHHFSGQGTREAIDWYRANYVPSERYPEPRTFLTVNAALHEDREEALRLARPHALAMLSLRTGGPLRAQLSVEEAAEVVLPEAHVGLVDAMTERWVVDSVEAGRSRIAALAEEFGVDEVMVHPVAGALAGDPDDRMPGREETLRLLAG